MKKRIISLLLAIFMVVGMLPLSGHVHAAEAVTMTGGEVLYLKPNSNWLVDNARFAAYFFGTGDAWASMEAVPGNEGYYQLTVPTGSWTNVIFCRMNPTDSTNTWDNKWNQSGDLTYDGVNNLFTVPDDSWDGATTAWSQWTPEVPAAEITGMSLSVDGTTYTEGNITLTAESKVIMTLTGTNFANLGDNNLVWLDADGYFQDLVHADNGWVIDTAANTATLDFEYCYGVEYTFASSNGFELQYSNDGKATWIGSGIYLTYDDGSSEPEVETTTYYFDVTGYATPAFVYTYSAESQPISFEHPVTLVEGNIYSIEVTSDVARVMLRDAEDNLIGASSITLATDGKNLCTVSTRTWSVYGEEEPACTHENVTTNTVDATCVADGSTTVTCDDCGETVSTETIPATGEHSYENGACVNCGAADPDAEVETTTYYFDVTGYAVPVVAYTYDSGNSIVSINHPVTHVEENIYSAEMTAEIGTVQLIDAEGNIIGGMGITLATDGKNLYTVSTFTWSVYGEEEPACTHENVTTNTVDATCVADGSTTVTCDDCGENVSTETIPATGEHSYENGACVNCGAADPDAEVETTTYYFDVTGYAAPVYAYTYNADNGRISGNHPVTLVEGNIYSTEVTADVAKVMLFDAEGNIIGGMGITLATDGKNLYTVSTFTWSVYGEEEPACTHENVTTNTVDATCVADGSTTVTCGDCGETVSTETIPATGEHSYEDGVCSVCGQGPIVITQQPESYEGNVNDTAVFTVVAEGEDLTYQWYYYNVSESDWLKSYSTGSTTATLQVQFLAYRDGQQYRCEIADAEGNTVITDVVTMDLLNGEITITAQPESVEAGALNSTYTFAVTASGNNLTYLWQVSTDDGDTWTQTWLDGYNTDTLTVKLNANRSGNQYRCVISNADNKVTSEPAKLVIQEASVEILSHPQDVKLLSGEVAAFDVEATGTDLTFSWYYSFDNGGTWNYLQDTETGRLTVHAGTHTQALFRCKITDGSGKSVWSDPARLMLKAEIVAQPTSQACEIGETVTFTVNARGEGLKYLWYRSDDNGANWYQTWLGGYNTDTLSFAVNTSRCAMYRCVITDSQGETVTTEEVTLSLKVVQLAIVTQPENVTIAALNDQVTFIVGATGNGLTYRWYARAEGGEWGQTWLSGYNTNTLSFVGINSRIAKEYKCVITDANGKTVETNAVKATVG